MTRSLYVRAGHTIVMLATALGLAHLAHAQGTPKLVAPVYTGAATLGCSVGDIATRCTFGTKDTIDKVKAFYDKALGNLHEAKNGYVVPVRAGKAVEGEGTYSTVFATVRIDSSPPVAPPAESSGMRNQAAVQRYKYLSVLSQGVLWGADAQSTEQMKKQGWHSQQDFDALFKRYGYLESSFFAEDEVAAARKQYDGKRAAIAAKYSKAGEANTRSTQAAGEQMQRDNASRRQELEREREENCKRGPTPQQKADREELKRIIKKNSAERYRRFVAATEKMDKAGCNAAMTPGSPAMDAGMEIGQILNEDPEARAYAEKMQKREEANRPPRQNAGAEGFTKGVRASQEQQVQQMNESWQAGLDYLAAMDKIAARTRITISGEKFGADGGGIVTDRAKVEELWAKRKSGGDGDADTAAASGGRSGSDKPASAEPAGQSAKSSPPPAKEPEKKEGISTDDALKAGKKGFNVIKKLF